MLPALLMPTYNMDLAIKYLSEIYNKDNTSTLNVDSIKNLDISQLISKLIESNELEKKKNDFPALLSICYAMANADGEISKKEDKVIDIFINQYSSFFSKDEEIIKNIQKRKKSLKLSDALEYVNEKNEKSIRKQVKEFVLKVAEADAIDSKLERLFKEKLELFIKNGKDKSYDEIIKRENEESVTCLYISSVGAKSKIPTAKVISSINNLIYRNKDILLDNEYYIENPVNKRFLLALNDIDKIDIFKVQEWQSLARKLGAKKFTCTTKEDDKFSKTKNLTGNVETPEIKKVKAEINGGYNSEYDEIKERFQTFNSEWLGCNCSEEKEKIIEDLCWLRNEPQALELIDSIMSNNKSRKFSFGLSLSNSNTFSNSLTIGTSLEFLGKINVNLKADYKSKITKSEKFNQHIEIEF